MTNIGDKVKLKKYDETIYTVVNVEDEHVRVIDGTGTQLMQVRKDFVDVVEQYIDYKQRADELERRWNELKEWLDEQSSEYMTKYRKTYNERDDEKSETYNEIFNKMMTIEKENNNA